MYFPKTHHRHLEFIYSILEGDKMRPEPDPKMPSGLERLIPLLIRRRSHSPIDRGSHK